jgi:multiple sugar transport system permease protein
MKRERFTAVSAVKHLVLFGGTVLMVLPFIWMLSTSFKPSSEVLSWPPRFIPKTWTLDNYVNVFKTAPFVRFFLNSLLVSTVSTVSILITSTLAGYIFGKFDFPLKNLLFMLILATAMVPFETYMIPLYMRMVQFGWVNKFIGLVAPYLVMSYGIFFMRQNVHNTIPDELLDAARIDGLSEFGIYRKIILPLLAGSANALAIFAFMQSWAAFIWPLIITSSRELWTMELGLGMFQYRFSVDLGPINAGSVLSILPVLTVFLFLRKHIVKGITLTGMKA